MAHEGAARPPGVALIPSWRDGAQRQGAQHIQGAVRPPGGALIPSWRDGAQRQGAQHIQGAVRPSGGALIPSWRDGAQRQGAQQMNARPWPYPRVLAHRGGGTLAPENTLGAIRTALAYGFRAIEIDAMLPRDDLAVLMHDATLARTAGMAGNVTDFGAAELNRFDVGRWHSAGFTGERIPLLTDVLAFCRAEGIWVNVELKPAPGREADTGRFVAAAVASVYADLVRPGGAQAEHANRAVPLLSSFSIEALMTARAAAPDLPRGWLIDRVPPDWRARLDTLGCVALHTNQRHLTAPQAADIKAGGTWLFCYTVNDPARARRLLDWGVDALCTDRIDLIGPDFAG